MKEINSVHFIHSLAEITSHDNRELLEKSLIETLQEYHDAKAFWLYQVMTTEPELSLGFLTYSTSRDSVSTREALEQDLPEYIFNGVIRAVANGEVEVVRNPSDPGDIFIIYPAFYDRHDVFAVLIENVDAENIEDQRLAHAFLRIYSNYLRLLEISRRDKLTGLLNRETLEHEISSILILNAENVPAGFEIEPEVVENARQHKDSLRYWLGVLDVDHFKQINDTYGHLYGDEILILIARLIEKSVRCYDLVFRFGGEEFVILLKAFDENDARQTFERIRTTVGHHDYAKVEQVTISIGVTEVTSQIMGASDVIREADSALYYAKQHGRDQVQFYQRLIAQGLIEEPQQEVESGGIKYF